MSMKLMDFAEADVALNANGDKIVGFSKQRVGEVVDDFIAHVLCKFALLVVVGRDK